MAVITKQQEEMLEWGLYEIGLSERTVNHLHGIDVFTVEHLLLTSRSRLLEIDNVGEKTLREIFKCLANYGWNPKPLEKKAKATKS